MAKVTRGTNGSLGPATNGGTDSYHGTAASGGSASTRKQPLAHIDDIISTNIEYDRNKPMDKLLSSAEMLLRQADMYRTFGGRIDMALTCYIKASILIFESAQQNMGWPALQTDNPAQKQRHSSLVRRAKDMHSVFDKIKEDIKADNARSGIQSRAQLLQSTDGPSTTVAPVPSSSPAKVKPSVRPKPEALHGHAIDNSGALSKTPPKRAAAAEDLSTRFAKLRANTTQSQQPVVQDPRIRTQPIFPPPSAGRRDSYSPMGRPSLSIDSNLIGLPQVPGAIYKPARGTVSTEADDLPSSSSRRFSLGRSLTSGSLSSPAIKSPTTGPILEEPVGAVTKSPPPIPQGDTISVNDLRELMKAGFKNFSVLLVDIRSREAFDDGHIMSQATICIEHEVLTRKDISASQIAESMVLAPSAEQAHFERRHEFDLVVYYDQDSTRIGTRKDDPTELAVQGFYNALTFFDFGNSKTKTPKLLEGGVEAWTSAMGNNSLATTESSVGQPRRSPAMTRKILQPSTRRRKSYVPKPIQDPDEARRWERSINDPETYTTRDLEDVLRRFPPVTRQESMISLPVVPASKTVQTLQQPPAHSTYPPPVPAPPAPARARQPVGFDSAEGLREDKLPKKARSDKRRKFVGLVNPGNLCYANSSLQALFGTQGFSNDLFSGQWERDYCVPMKQDEKIPNPQLMGKMLAQLFAWMEKALIDPMEARTLMQYLRHVHSMDSSNVKRPPSEIFGNPSYQHDAQEFFSYVIEAIHDETNRHRNLDEVTIPGVETVGSLKHSILHEAVRYWHKHALMNESLVTKYWRSIEASLSRCHKENCGYKFLKFDVADITPCPIAKKTRSKTHGGIAVECYRRLEDSLAANASAEDLGEDYECERCRSKNTVSRIMSFARLPERLVFSLNRNTADNDGRPIKLHNRFEFPIRGLDMEPYFVPADQRHIDADDREVVATLNTDRRHFDPQMKYDCYAVVCHIGANTKSGHYIAYVRDQSSQDPTDWLEFNDTCVRKVKVRDLGGGGGGGASNLEDVTQKLYGNGRSNQQAYILFYERRP